MEDVGSPLLIIEHNCTHARAAGHRGPGGLRPYPTRPRVFGEMPRSSRSFTSWRAGGEQGDTWPLASSRDVPADGVRATALISISARLRCSRDRRERPFACHAANRSFMWTSAAGQDGVVAAATLTFHARLVRLARPGA